MEKEDQVSVPEPETEKNISKLSSEEMQNKGSWFGISLMSLTIVFVVGHLVWPQVTVLKYLANIVVLIFGSIMLSVLSENIQANSSFSLPFIWIMIVLMLGVILFSIYGWISTLFVLGGYAVICVVGRVLGRIMD
jgi:hypothetical protein